jgi:hypothetical protein
VDLNSTAFNIVCQLAAVVEPLNAKTPVVVLNEATDIPDGRVAVDLN